MTEDKFEEAIESFVTWSWQTEVIVSCVIAVILMVGRDDGMGVDELLSYLKDTLPNNVYNIAMS